MALLFDRLFSATTTRKKKRIPSTSRHEEDVHRKRLFTFERGQVRVVLFRECDFRGRKLLFDSNSIRKMQEKNQENDCYTFTKPSDSNELSEMVFGSVAMSFRGTYFKIHRLEKPTRFMFTQIFPGPRSLNSSRNTIQNSQHSMKLDDSGVSSNTSIGDGCITTQSDTLLVCRRTQTSPLEIPININHESSLYGDSGYVCSSSVKSEPLAIFEPQDNFLSSGNLYRRWLRRASTSLCQQSTFLADNSGEFRSKSTRPTSKLGLAIIIELTPNQENSLSRFLMEHIVLIESMLWRCRKSIENAYNTTKPHVFLPAMIEMADLSSEWLVTLLSGSCLNTNQWLSLSHVCDNHDSINVYDNRTDYESVSSSLTQSLNDLSMNFGKLFRIENTLNDSDKFINEFCELLEMIDVKDTNFFMSTLLTAVLTYHLGWVSSCLPTTSVSNKNPYNTLWTQLSDLYGAIGYPTKLAQTLITGTCRKEIISKILNCLTYFIRCCDVERKRMQRIDVNEENRFVETMCHQQSCIPKDNYKKYEDHLEEIMKNQKLLNATSNKEKSVPVIKKRMMKSQTCLTKLTDLAEEERAIFSKIDEDDTEKSNDNVVFVLGDNEELIGLKNDQKFDDIYGEFKDSDFVKWEDRGDLKPSTSWNSLEQAAENDTYFIQDKPTSRYVRSQSLPPQERKVEDENGKPKFRYSGVKFNLQQYPQILSNYMKSKNLEMTNLILNDKSLMFDQITTLKDHIQANLSKYDCNFEEEEEALQTPSNASDLEFSCDIFDGPLATTKESNCDGFGVRKIHTKDDKKSTKKSQSESGNDTRMKVINLPMPNTFDSNEDDLNIINYTTSLMRNVSDTYIPDMVLQGTVIPKQEWECKLKNDLALASQHSLIDQPIQEAVAIIANIDNWEVHLMSSHTYVIDRDSSGIRIGMSQLVADMLESLLQLWKSKVPSHYCLMHIEHRLQELCIQSYALAQLLLATEFCSMELLTSVLHLEVNDVPLLLAVASTHTPQVTQKYGLSFQ